MWSSRPLLTLVSSAAADAFAPSGTHKVVFSGAAAFAPKVGFIDPASSFFNHVDVLPASGMTLDSDVRVNGTLSRAAGGGLFRVNRASGPLTFNGFNFSGAGFGATSTGHFVINEGAANITINTSPAVAGTAGFHYVQLGTGTITWP